MAKQILFLLALLFVSFASAASISVTNSTAIPTSVTSPSSFSISYLLNYTSATSETVSVSFSGVNPTGTISLPSSTTLNSNETKTITVTYSVPSGASGTYSSTLTANTNNSLISSKSFSSSIVTASTSTSFNSSQVCRFGTNNSLIAITEITDDSDLDDEWEWRPLDDVSVEVEFENTGNDEEDFTVLLMFFDSAGKDVSDEVANDEDDLEIDVSNLDEGDDEKVTFNFQVNPEVDAGDYKVVAKVIKEGKEREQCVFSELDEELTVDKDDRSVIVKSAEGQTTASCGETIQFSADVANIGSEDEDQVKVLLFNKDLGLNVFKEITELDEGDSDSVLFEFQVPKTAKEGLYRLTFSTEFDYDDDDETYDEESDSDDDKVYSLNVLGNCGTTTNTNQVKPSISAKLASSAKVDQELIAEVVVKNNDVKTASFVVSAEEYQTWATASSTTEVFNLGAQESETISIKLVPTEDGQQTFVLKVVVNGQAYDQPVTVNVAAKTSLGSASLSTYLIGGIIFLVILIILVLIIKALKPTKED